MEYMKSVSLIAEAAHGPMLQVRTRQVERIALERYYNSAKWRITNSVKRMEYGFKLAFNIEKQQEVAGSKWDNLIVLDSCRYDHFEQLCDDYLDGALQRVLSPASCTNEWLKTVWNGFYDLTYISAMPGINSKGVPTAWGYVAAKHFNRIIDVWDFGWDSDIGTVPPQNVNKAVLDAMPLADRRVVIHYVQPHQPYIGETKITFPRQSAAKGPRTALRIKRLLEDGSLTLERLLRAYRDNLILVLKCIAELVPNLSGKTVVTADHGELLSEMGGIWHPCRCYHSKLREVPWFEVK